MNPAPNQRGIPQLFDRVFKCLMCLSNRAIITFIDGNSYLIEVQIRNDRDMGRRIFQYIMNEGRNQGPDRGDHVIQVNLPQARVIYWEPTPATPDRETFIFRFPGGPECRYEAPSLKFLEYTIPALEARGLALLLPFYVLKLRHKVKKAGTPAEREDLARQMGEIQETLTAAAERSLARGELTEVDLKSVLYHTRLLRDEIYSSYTEFEKEGKMWEHIKPIDVEKILRIQEENARVLEEYARVQEETTRVEEENVQLKEAARKLLEVGVSREQLAQASFLELAVL
jgi:hypothetical protein